MSGDLSRCAVCSAQHLQRQSTRELKRLQASLFRHAGLVFQEQERLAWRSARRSRSVVARLRVKRNFALPRGEGAGARRRGACPGGSRAERSSCHAWLRRASRASCRSHASRWASARSSTRASTPSPQKRLFLTSALPWAPPSRPWRMAPSSHGPAPGYGNLLILGLRRRLPHAHGPPVIHHPGARRESVSAGEVVGEVGDTGSLKGAYSTSRSARPAGRGPRTVVMPVPPTRRGNLAHDLLFSPEDPRREERTSAWTLAVECRRRCGGAGGLRCPVFASRRGGQSVHFYSLKGQGGAGKLVRAAAQGMASVGRSLGLARRFSRVVAPDLPGHGFSTEYCGGQVCVRNQFEVLRVS